MPHSQLMRCQPTSMLAYYYVFLLHSCGLWPTSCTWQWWHHRYTDSI